jgi:hypothetical protein
MNRRKDLIKQLNMILHNCRREDRIVSFRSWPNIEPDISQNISSAMFQRTVNMKVHW